MANSVIQLVAPDVSYLRVLIANVCFVGNETNLDWMLIDAGLPGSAEQIKHAAAALYDGNPPKTLILTHGHFDHVGAAQELASEWGIPVYAHSLEIPYLTGKASYPLPDIAGYPPPDPTVCNGRMAKISPLYPREPVHLGERVQPLPEDGSVPFLPGWRWIFTPGHTPGHVSLFREADRVLIAGDAFTTVRPESALAVMTQEKGVHGQPAYFTINRQVAKESIEQLQALNPAIAITGHGKPMRDGVLREELARLVRSFDTEVLPEKGYSVKHPVPLESPPFE